MPDPLDDAVPTGACQIHHNFELAEQILSTATLKLPQGLKPRLGLAACYFARVKSAKAKSNLKNGWRVFELLANFGPTDFR